MNILVSAYACEPNKGSEPEVGWQWVKGLAENNKVYVITRVNNKENIQNGLSGFKYKENIKFFYYDLPEFFLCMKKMVKINQLYYFFWQFGIISLARDIVNREDIDICHHITFVTFKVFSALAFVNKPFVFGPVGGGERAAYKFYKGCRKRDILKEIIRDIDILFARFNPLNLYTLRKATLILTTTKDTRRLIPNKYKSKCSIMQTIGIDRINESTKIIQEKNEFKLLYAGNLIYWKGINILLDSFLMLRKSNKNHNKEIKLSIVGKGRLEGKIKDFIKQNNLEDSIELLGMRDRNELLNMYKEVDLFIFPSLHDSGGMVVLESMANGTPVLCLNLGGPSVNIDKECGIIVEANSYSQVVKDIAMNIEKLSIDQNLHTKLSKNSLVKAENQFLWSKKIKYIEKIYSTIK